MFARALHMFARDMSEAWLINYVIPLKEGRIL